MFTAVLKAVLLNLLFFSLQYQTYCSREKGEPSYYKLMTNISLYLHCVVHLSRSVVAVSSQIDFVIPRR